MSCYTQKNINVNKLRIVGGGCPGVEGFISDSDSLFKKNVTIKKDLIINGKLKIKRSQLEWFSEENSTAMKDCDPLRTDNLSIQVNYSNQENYSLKSVNIQNNKEIEIDLNLNKTKAKNIFYSEDENKLSSSCEYLHLLSNNISKQFYTELNIELKKINNNLNIQEQECKFGGKLFHMLFENSYKELVESLKRIQKCYCGDDKFYSNWLEGDTFEFGITMDIDKEHYNLKLKLIIV